MKSFRFHPAAAAETEAEARFYLENSPDLARAFLDDLNESLHDARQFPDAGIPSESGCRRRIFRRFPFSLVYLPIEDEIVVVAVAHHRRLPGYWRNRAE